MDQVNAQPGADPLQGLGARPHRYPPPA
jgi:hypothetical protein